MTLSWHVEQLQFNEAGLTGQRLDSLNLAVWEKA